MQQVNDAFWQLLDGLTAEHETVIDRPKGSRHPRYPHVVYPLDYGYLMGSKAMDGGGIDLWLGSDADRRVKGIICTVDRLKGDAEIKLLIGCTEEEAARALQFHNESEYMKGILIPRQAGAEDGGFP